jgi:hypothetical protein
MVAIRLKRDDPVTLGAPSRLRAVVHVEHTLRRGPEARQLRERAWIWLDQTGETRDQKRTQDLEQPLPGEDRQHPLGAMVGEHPDRDDGRPRPDQRQAIQRTQHRHGHLGLPAGGFDRHFGIGRERLPKLLELQPAPPKRLKQAGVEEPP